MTEKQKTPKLCMLRRVAQIGFLGSLLSHTPISVKAKIRSMINNNITEAII